uniref:Uncharacterized protein n=1 Tax=Timema cristinae TaxID=61476 RepID=A0A7R9CTB2_TIMCR|nr:unnamed protein product [Timema cristinae]
MNSIEDSSDDDREVISPDNFQVHLIAQAGALDNDSDDDNKWLFNKLSYSGNRNSIAGLTKRISKYNSREGISFLLKTSRTSMCVQGQDPDKSSPSIWTTPLTVNMVNGISVNGLGEVAMDATPQSSNLIGLGKQLSNDLSLGVSHTSHDI